MNRPSALQATRSHPAGFSVVELMVALAITAFLLIGLVQIFSSVRASYSLQESLARVQENSRFANSFLTRHLREAGRFPFAEHESAEVDLGFIFPTILGNNLPPPIDAAGTSDGGGTTADAVRVNIFTDRDCFDNPNATVTTTGAAATWHKQITFSHDGANNELEYSCAYGAPALNVNPPVVIANQPILNNVETLQFQYGEDLNNDASADRYVLAGNWAAPGNIVAIRTGLILTSEALGTLPEDAQTINLIGTTFDPTTQRRLRRPVVLNINLRNQTL